MGHRDHVASRPCGSLVRRNLALLAEAHKHTSMGHIEQACGFSPEWVRSWRVAKLCLPNISNTEVFAWAFRLRGRSYQGQNEQLKRRFVDALARLRAGTLEPLLAVPADVHHRPGTGRLPQHAGRFDVCGACGGAWCTGLPIFTNVAPGAGGGCVARLRRVRVGCNPLPLHARRPESRNVGRPRRCGASGMWLHLPCGRHGSGRRWRC